MHKIQFVILVLFVGHTLVQLSTAQEKLKSTEEKLTSSLESQQGYSSFISACQYCSVIKAFDLQIVVGYLSFDTGTEF